MGRFVAEPINPYAPPQCDATPPSPGAMELVEPIVLRGEINLAHEVLVMRRWKHRPTRWISRLLAILALSSAACSVYRFWTTGGLYDLIVAALALLAAPSFWFGSWIALGLFFGACALLGIPYQTSLWAQATNEGLGTCGSAGEEFLSWSSFSRMEMSGELIFLYGLGNQRGIPIVILNLHWCTTCADEERLLSLVEARFGPDAPQLCDPVPHRDPIRLPAAPNPAIAGEVPLVLAGLVDLDQLLRISRLKRQPHIQRFVGVVFVLAIVFVGAILWWFEPGPELWAASGLQIAVLSLFLVLGLLKPQFDAWLLRRSFESGRTRPEWTTWTISTAGVSLLTESLETHEAWSQLQYRGEEEEMLVLFNPSSFRFHFLPREFATDEQWERLRMLVRQAVDRGELISRETRT